MGSFAGFGGSLGGGYGGGLGYGGGGFFNQMYQQPQMMSQGYQPYMGNPFSRQQSFYGGGSPFGGFFPQQMPQMSLPAYQPYSTISQHTGLGTGAENASAGVAHLLNQQINANTPERMAKQVELDKNNIMSGRMNDIRKMLEQQRGIKLEPASQPTTTEQPNEAQQMRRYAPMPALAPPPSSFASFFGRGGGGGGAMQPQPQPLTAAPPKQTLPAGLANFSPGGAQLGKGFLASRFGGF